MPTIKFLPQGPYQVEGLKELTDTTGNKISATDKIMLCRCGASGKKPYCDGSHVESGFTSDKETDAEWDYRTDYQEGTLVIHDNRGICSHAGFCTTMLPQVFLQGT